MAWNTDSDLHSRRYRCRCEERISNIGYTSRIHSNEYGTGTLPAPVLLWRRYALADGELPMSTFGGEL
jgi:hypothetical protein